MEELTNHLRLECEFCMQDDPKQPSANEPKIPIVKHGESSNGPKGQGKKRSYNDNNNTKKGFQGMCWECNKPGHKKKDCTI